MPLEFGFIYIPTFSRSLNASIAFQLDFFILYIFFFWGGGNICDPGKENSHKLLQYEGLRLDQKEKALS